MAFNSTWLEKQNKPKPAEGNGGVLSWFSKGGDIEKGEGTQEEKTSLVGNLNPFSSTTEQPKECCCNLTRSERLQGFTFLLIISVIFFLVAFFIGLPLVLLSPGKFGLSFTLGSLIFMTAFAILEGPVSHLKRTCSTERLPFTLTYFISMFLTLYACLIAKSYLLTVAFSILQIMALAWYAMSQVPGGALGLKYLFKMTFTTITTMLRGFCAICFR